MNSTTDERIASLERRVARLEAENRRLWARLGPPEWTRHHEKYAAGFGNDRPGYNIAHPFDSANKARLARALREGTTKP